MNKKFVFILVIFLFFINLVLAQENAGAVVGIVVDSLNNLVEGADIRVQCGLETFSSTTDKFGSFVFTNLPEGSCKFYARFGDGIGTANEKVSQNEIKEMIISLDKTIISTTKNKTMTWFFLFVLILLVLIIFYIKFKKIKSIKKSKQLKPRILGRVKTEKTNILLMGLSEKEKQIVEYLIKQKGQSTQSKIRFDLNMPKATISRNIKNLENKKIIRIDTIGKLRRIELIDEFR